MTTNTIQFLATFVIFVDKGSLFTLVHNTGAVTYFMGVAKKISLVVHKQGGQWQSVGRF